MNDMSFNQNRFATDTAIRLPSATYAECPHDSRSDQFRHIPTFEIVDLMKQAGFVPVRASARAVRNPDKDGFQKHVIRFRREAEADLKLARVGETVSEIALLNAHDGTSGLNLIPALMRLACLNGLVIQDANLGKISIPHRGANIADRIIEGSYAVIERADQGAIASVEWSKVNLSPEKALEFADRALSIKYVTKPDEKRSDICPIEPAHLLRPRRYGDNGPDLWRTFNRVQENLIKGGQAGRIGDKFRSSRAVKSAEKDITLNAALWGLAKEYAEAA
jgi:Domain of unknown function (DUF932)